MRETYDAVLFNNEEEEESRSYIWQKKKQKKKKDKGIACKNAAFFTMFFFGTLGSLGSPYARGRHIVPDVCKFSNTTQQKTKWAWKGITSQRGLGVGGQIVSPNCETDAVDTLRATNTKWGWLAGGKSNMQMRGHSLPPLLNRRGLYLTFVVLDWTNKEEWTHG